jgi:replication factor C large subunit
MFADKYAPFTLNAIIGNRTAIARLTQFGSEMQKGGRAKPMMLAGPSGTGKTSAARALAYVNGFEVLEFNSSDYRDVETLTNKVVPATQTRGLFNKRILIIFDEIDELSTKFDAGAEKVISQIVKTSKQPIIFTANDYWDKKISFLRGNVEKIDFKKVAQDDVLRLLKEILAKEGKQLDEHVLNEIVRRSDGDVRGAVNDLEIMIDANPELVECLGIRDRKMEIFAVLDKIFLSSNFEASRLAMVNSDIDMGMMIHWIDENIPNRYKSKSGINKSYQYLSKASAFFERASRINYYGYLRYAQFLLSSGVTSANDGHVSMLSPYAFPAHIQYMSKVKKEKNELNAVTVKLLRYLHSSKKEIVANTLPLVYRMIAKAQKEGQADEVESFMSRTFALDEDETKTIVSYYRFKALN